MRSVYIEFPSAYREINSIVEKFTDYNYFDISDTIDKYIELLVWMEANRRWHRIDTENLRRWLYSEIARYPVTDDYFANNVISKYIINSNDLWRAVRSEMTFTPNSGFLMWHVDNGLWKIITTGVTPYVE